VKRSKGELRVTAYFPDNRDYSRIEYDPQLKTGVYTKYTSWEGDQRETIEEFWPSGMYDCSVRPESLCVEVHRRDPEWFDANKDPGYLGHMSSFIAGLERW